MILETAQILILNSYSSTQMFYSQYILAKKGPLGKIWLAAHFEKKLTKSQVYGTDITESVQNIIHPTIPLALRVCGHLMLGIVRIYSDKVRYLSTDARDAMTKINLAFRPQSTRVDIDQAQSGGKIDDANYALLPLDDVDQPLNAPFVRKPIRQLAKVDDSDMTSFFTIGDIDIELQRAAPRQSIRSSIASAEFGRMSDVFTPQRFDDDLPAFDFPGDDAVAKDMTMAMAVDHFAPSASVAPFDVVDSSFHSIVVAEQASNVAVEEPAAKSRKKRRKIQFNEQTEIADEVWRQRLTSVEDIVKVSHMRPADIREEDLRVDAKDVAVMFTDVTGSLRLCPELQELAIFSAQESDEGIPFALHPEFVTAAVEAPEERRHQQYVDEARGASFTPASRRETMEGISPLGAREYPSGLGDDMSFYQDQRDEAHFEPVSEVAKAVTMQFGGDNSGRAYDLSAEQQHERTNKIFAIVERELATQGEVPFDSFCDGCSKHVAAGFFLEMLQLKTWGKLDLQQSTGFGPILVTKCN